ncbi:MAG: hypothetical protein KGI33_04125 [Thaumarchaeota archaeon]|nr:hypothetical protein [Nitrososphaerota archaeon]
MSYKVLTVLGMLFLISAMQVTPLVYASSVSAGGAYSQSSPQLIASSVDSNVPNVVTATQADLSTYVWQGADTDTSYFLQEVLEDDYQPSGSSGWDIGFYGQNSNGQAIDNTWTNSLAQPGCTVLYDQSVTSTNDIFADVQQSSANGCTSMTQTYTFSDPNGSYGSYLSPIQLYLEWYDTNCSDYSGMGNVDFTSGSVENSYGTSSTPTYTAYYPQNGCFSSTAGSGYVTIS